MTVPHLKPSTQQRDELLARVGIKIETPSQTFAAVSLLERLIGAKAVMTDVQKEKLLSIMERIEALSKEVLAPLEYSSIEVNLPE